MATCALLGEAVGRAAALAATHNCAPHDVYLAHMDALQESLLRGDCFLPHKMRKISPICRNAQLSGADESIRNGQDRWHSLYRTDESDLFCAEKAAPVTYFFDKTYVTSVHIVFDSDLERSTLDGSWVARQRSTRANLRLDYPQLTMPKTLCREFRLLGERDGKVVELMHITDNHKRSYHIPVNQEFNKLTLMPIDSWGNAKIPLISFDFA